MKLEAFNKSRNTERVEVILIFETDKEEEELHILVVGYNTSASNCFKGNGNVLRMWFSDSNKFRLLYCVS